MPWPDISNEYTTSYVGITRHARDILVVSIFVQSPERLQSNIPGYYALKGMFRSSLSCDCDCGQFMEFTGTVHKILPRMKLSASILRSMS